MLFTLKKITSSALRNTVVISCWLCSNVLLAQSETANQQESSYKQSINTIATEIRSISQALNSNKARLKTEQDQLAVIEQRIVGLNKELSATKKQIGEQQQVHTQLDKQLSELDEQQSSDKAALAELIRQRYMQGEPNYVKMVLNQQNPYAVGRLNNYYQYFSQAQQVKLEEIRQQIRKSQALQQEKQKLITQLAAKQQQQEKQRAQLKTAKQERDASLQKLNNKIAQGNTQLKALQQDRARLNKLLQQIAAQKEKLRKLEQQKARQAAEAVRQRQSTNKTTAKKPPVLPPVKGGFAKQRGRLQFPVNGRVEYRYGNRLPASGMRAQGTLFKTNGSQPVKSIFRGNVLFADYLKGYGLLLIIDHGDDHISLYGHNERLFKSVGDQVSTNEVIANSGVSGGLQSAGLYFEIRQNAAPVDPAKWCR